MQDIRGAAHPSLPGSDVGVLQPAASPLEDKGAANPSRPEQRIVGTFLKQMWDIRDYLHDVEETPFDATDAVLRMDLASIQALVDNKDSTDAIGSGHVEWGGPFQVFIVDSIRAYFGVVSLSDITQEALAAARALAEPKVWEHQSLTFTVRVTVRRDPTVPAGAVAQSLNARACSQQSGVVVDRTEVLR